MRKGEAMRTIKNVFRRKVRAILTISGIVIGVFALIVMGAMAEKITLLVDGGVKWTGDKVTVAAGSNGVGALSTEPLSTAKIKQIEKVPGVARASANVTMLFSKKQSSVNMGMPEMIAGGDGRGDKYETFKVRYAQGREVKASDRGKAALGSDIAKRLKSEIGKDVTIRGKKFEVVGIMEKTLTAPDQSVYISLHDAQRLFRDDLPEMVRPRVKADTLATGFTVFVKKGHDPEDVAAAINERVKGVTASGPKAFKEQVQNSTKIFTSIIFGIALISLLVGGLSVVNTMTMAVSERTREIGIRKAIGARRLLVIRQFLAESATISAIGGLIGLALGALFVFAANSGNSGTPLFLITARLVGGSLGFALLLGVLSGLYPAWHAASLNPVSALRYE